MAEHSENLDDIREELAEEQAEELAAQDAEAEAEIHDHIEHAEAQAPVDLVPAQAVTVLVETVTVIGCKLARVPGPQPEEIVMLSWSLKGVLDTYDLGEQMDPRTAAWVGLGMTALAFVTPRLNTADQVDTPDENPDEMEGGADGEGYE